MQRLLMFLGVAVIFSVSFALAAGEPGDGPGVYLGDGTEALCGLQSSSGFRPPSIPDESSLLHVDPSELVVAVRTGEAQPGQEVVPRNLRLVRVDEGETPMFRVVGVSSRYDAVDEQVFYLDPGELEDGLYALAVERPGWVAGLTELDRVMEFLDCFFVVERAPVGSAEGSDAAEAVD